MRSGEVGGCLPSARPFDVLLLLTSSEPDQPQTVKARAVAPPLRGFGLDGLTPARFGLSKQTKADWAHSAPNPGCYSCTNNVLSNGCDTPAT